MSHSFAPFSGLAVEFNSDLELVSANIGDNQTREVLKAKPAVTPGDKTKPYLPGQPRIRLDRPLHNGEDPVLKYVQGSHLTTQLDELLPFMRYIFVQTPSYIHIMALHHQKAHARKIVVDESPGLHLVWYYEFIFIKPVPAYFYSRAFWTYIQNADEKAYHASLGFMRSYYWLIQYEIDYLDALAQHLIPRKGDGAHPTYEEWCAFIEPFGQVGDKSVSRRFHYGELRLTRINRAAFLFKRKLAYFHIYPQWGSFLAHFLAPIVTVFAVCSVVLNSMQVTLAALEADRAAAPGAWPRFLDASVWFPVVVMLGIAVVMVASLVGVGVMGVGDLVRGNVVRARKKKGDPRAGGGSHGMVW
ncbi:hypothetical protein BT67DRAFT_427002 [Trichocladium antarcticum]|uniref:Uncharacterized protein n=1 Tax=Trichocladium antarcticum TaxID=1450529 RepID=A0AAN6ZBT3_9PEZI|nr:hypothetical protein BT67DRAFT_427002 [Trichocladium antarcticum]